jgi:hypothetical protein
MLFPRGICDIARPRNLSCHEWHICGQESYVNLRGANNLESGPFVGSERARGKHKETLTNVTQCQRLIVISLVDAFSIEYSASLAYAVDYLVAIYDPRRTEDGIAPAELRQMNVKKQVGAKRRVTPWIRITW